MQHKYDFPWWYGLVKWGVPLTLAFTSAAWICMCLTGGIMWPSAFSALSWTPGMFKAMDTMHAVGFICSAAITVGSVVGFTTAVTLRALFLNPILENLLIGSQHEIIQVENSAEARTSQQYYEQITRSLEEDLATKELQREKISQELHEARAHLKQYRRADVPAPTRKRKKKKRREQQDEDCYTEEGAIATDIQNNTFAADLEDEAARSESRSVSPCR